MLGGWLSLVALYQAVSGGFGLLSSRDPAIFKVWSIRFPGEESLWTMPLGDWGGSLGGGGGRVACVTSNSSTQSCLPNGARKLGKWGRVEK